MLRTLTTLISIVALVGRARYAASAATSGGGGNWNFVAPVTNLGLALQAITGSIVIIALVVIVGQHLMHREDWGGMFRNVVFVLIGGAIILAAGNFMSNAGVTGATF
jgi:uncharacterized membrane protein